MADEILPRPMVDPETLISSGHFRIDCLKEAIGRKEQEILFATAALQELRRRLRQEEYLFGA
jgi:hypothetical protein